ncbi:hypothetical protein [Streptomyces atriruber]|uniref:hypothetical protein n=1 Tax=Streptomyces atriruber TaxID=545121 RepID=UPI0006E13953|nr:hypothetical protein [Streptomyces atriruber]
MLHDGYEGYDGLGDEELMTVQGLDGYEGYDGYAGYDGYEGYGAYDDLGQYEDLSQYDDIGQPEELGHAYLPHAPRTARCVPGEVRQGRDGRLYQWVEGYDGLGSPVGFWSVLPAIAKAALPLAARYLPQVLRAVGGRRRMVPRGVPAPVPYGLPMPIPSAVPAQPPADEDEELRGYGEGDEPLAADEEPGMGRYGDCGDRGGTGGVEGYVHERSTRTRKFRRPAQAPELWRPIW